MKNLYLACFLALATTFGAVAQTLVIDDHFDGATAANYDVTGGTGKIGGTNTSANQGIYQLIDPDHGSESWGIISAVRIDFASILSNASTMTLVIMEDDNGTPGAEIHTEALTYSDLANSNAGTNPNGSAYTKEVALSSAVYVPGNRAFWIGVRFQLGPNNTFAIRTTSAGDPFSDGATHTVSEPLASTPGNRSYEDFVSVFSRNVALAIFPVVDINTSVGNYLENQIELGQNQPNPFQGSTLIPYTLDQASNVTLEVMDVTGKVVMSQNSGFQAAGEYKMELNAELLTAGIYFYTMSTSDGVRVTRKMTVSE